MGDFNNIKFAPRLNLKLGAGGPVRSGGDGGSVFIFTDEISGDGRITADGGEGDIGGKGGSVKIFAKRNHFLGELSAKGGKRTK